MSTLEAKVKEAVCKELDSLGAYYFKPATGGYGKSGVGDIVGCYLGRFFMIECKAGKGTTTALQDRELQRTRDAGGFALVVNETNIKEIESCLKKF
jgi:Holliday junction resolvase